MYSFGPNVAGGALFLLLALPFYAVYFAAFVAVLGAPVLIPVSLLWAAVLRRVVR